MAAYTRLVRSPFPWLAALGSLLAFSQSSGFGFLSIFVATSALFLILCPVILCRLKQYQQISARRENSPTRSTQEALSESSLQHKLVRPANDSEVETVEGNVGEIVKQVQVSKHKKQLKENKTDGGVYLHRSPEVLLSDSESVDHTTTSSEDSENDSMFRENLSNSTNYSDGSISDEESLIEIALPTGHYVDSKRSQDPSWYGLQHQKWSDCSLKSHFRQQNWMEMLNEMNEENFIEIDLCMGSIKCSRFQIQA
ncbi:uncharacterized protein [Spinacia oleracea]|uniref:Uncharacterized protein n=1 Tax=Spinacia oleracea TaxID=3562 RepID=A0A9R0JET9_SPIOL|nr:uncharacterized protein LOC110805444 [Spinacia oleracea]